MNNNNNWYRFARRGYHFSMTQVIVTRQSQVTLGNGHSSISDCPSLFNDALQLFFLDQFVFRDRFAISSKGSSIKDVLGKTAFWKPPPLSNIVSLEDCIARKNVRNAKHIAIWARGVFPPVPEDTPLVQTHPPFVCGHLVCS